MRYPLRLSALSQSRGPRPHALFEFPRLKRTRARLRTTNPTRVSSRCSAPGGGICPAFGRHLTTRRLGSLPSAFFPFLCSLSFPCSPCSPSHLTPSCPPVRSGSSGLLRPDLPLLPPPLLVRSLLRAQPPVSSPAPVSHPPPHRVRFFLIVWSVSRVSLGAELLEPRALSRPRRPAAELLALRLRVLCREHLGRRRAEIRRESPELQPLVGPPAARRWIGASPSD